MKFAPFVNIQCRKGFDYSEVYRARMDECVLAEELGFDAIFLAEHAFSEHGRPSPAVSLGHLSARTSRIRLGTAVSVLTWHNPVEVAQDYATVDVLSGGRLDFGIGRGGRKHEFDGYGVDWLTSPERYLEALKIVLKAWEGEPFFVQGGVLRISRNLCQSDARAKTAPAVVSTDGDARGDSRGRAPKHHADRGSVIRLEGAYTGQFLISGRCSETGKPNRYGSNRPSAYLCRRYCRQGEERCTGVRGMVA